MTLSKPPLIPPHICPRILVITGPTASGKSELAAELASRFHGEIINADSMQVYNALPILTNQPSPHLIAKAPHHLFAYVDPHSESHHVKAWLDHVALRIPHIIKRQKIPIICGGSGLYIHSLIHGISPVPEIPKDIRNTLRLRIIHEGPHALHHELSRLSPSSARLIAPCDSARITRSLEVLIASGQPLSYWQTQEHILFVDPLTVRSLLILPEKENWKKQCALRLHTMIPQGLLDEISSAHTDTWLPSSPLHRAIGLQPLLAHIQGKLSLEDATLKVIRDTQRYGKRQLTWFRNQLSPHVTISSPPSPSQTQQIAHLLDDIITAMPSDPFLS